MASVDNRVVNMTFQSAGFLTGVSGVINALSNLKSHLNSLKGSESALNGLNAAGAKMNLGGIAKDVDTIASRFSWLGMAATAAFSTITVRATMAAEQMISKFTVQPILAGLREYENELNTTAVIMANTGLSGERGMAQIRTALNELNTYADKTIYSFEDMTSAIGKFTAAGVSLKDSVVAIKGLANLAALSGSSAQQAAVAQYQLSQAIATGTIRLMDWNSVVNAGMGGKVFQNSLIATARVHGTAVDAMIKKNGSFRESLQEGWLTSTVLLETLAKFTGDLGKEQLKQMGYTDKQIALIQKQAQAAVDAATKIRTVTQLISATAEAVQSAWAGVFRALFGNMEQATKLWTGVGAALSKVFVTPVNNLQQLLSAWGEMGGRELLINALTDAFKQLGAVMKTIGSAFREVFPKSTAADLVNLTMRFHEFIASLKPSAATLQSLHSIFGGFFSAIKIGVDILKGIGSVIHQMISALLPAGATILGVAAKLGDFVTNLRKAIESGQGFSNVFKSIGTVLSAPLKIISSLVTALGRMAMGLGKSLQQPFQNFINWLKNAFSNLGSAIASGISTGNFSAVMTAINGILMGGVFVVIMRFFKNLTTGVKTGFGIGAIFANITNSLKALQTSLNAGTLQKIGIALGILTASIVALSLVNAGRLTKSLTAMTVMFGQLMASLAILAKLSTGPLGIIKMAAIGAALNMISSALLIMSASVALLGQLSWGEIAKGLSSIAAMLTILVVAVTALSKNTGGVIAASFAMILMATALNVMAGAVAMLGNMDWGTLLKGVGTIAALLAVVALFDKFGGGKNLISTAASMILLAAALNLMALAIKQLGALDWGTIGTGIGAIALSLVTIAVAMRLMPSNMLLTGAGLLVVAAALVILSRALTKMGGMSWGEIAKSIVTLASSLVILAAAMIVMSGSLAGAAALLVVSAALAIFVPTLLLLGSASWQTIITGLIGLAAAFTVIGLAGLLLTPVVPTLLALSAAMLLLGVALLAAGAGIALAGAGFTALGIALATSGQAIFAFITGLLNLLPLAIQKFGEGIVAFAGVIARSGPALVGAFSAVLNSMLQAISRNLPLILHVMGQIITGILNLINQYAPRIISTFINLILSLLNAIASRVGQFVTAATNIMVNFLNGIARNLPRVINAGVNVIISFIQGIANAGVRLATAAMQTITKFCNDLAAAIRANSGAMRAAGLNLASAIIDGITGGLWSLAGRAISAAASIGSQILGALGKAIKFFSPSHIAWEMGESIAIGLALGISSAVPEATAAAEKTGAATLLALQNALSSADAASMIELQPKITPVIDLSQAKRGFDDLAAMSTAAQVVPITTSRTAASISADYVPAGGEGGAFVMPGGTYLTFTQNNTSPKALSAAEIYRQTRNQLSQMKGALPA